MDAKRLRKCLENLSRIHEGFRDEFSYRYKKLKRVFMNPYIGRFLTWERDAYHAWSPDDDFCVWISNGFRCFTDTKRIVYRERERVIQGNYTLVTYAGRRKKKQIWKALMHDLKQAEEGTEETIYDADIGN